MGGLLFISFLNTHIPSHEGILFCFCLQSAFLCSTSMLGMITKTVWLILTSIGVRSRGNDDVHQERRDPCKYIFVSIHKMHYTDDASF